MLQLLAVLAVALPEFATSGDIEPQAALRSAAEAAWTETVQSAKAAGMQLPAQPPRIQLRRGRFERGESGHSEPGLIWLRQDEPWRLDAHLLQTLGHEIAHQLLFWACSAAGEDQLFHEAFALAVSQEMATWLEGPYQSLPSAVSALRSHDLDSPSARRGLARLIGEGRSPGEPLPAAISERLRQCSSDSRWVSLAPEDLAELPLPSQADAAVVVSRHSGEVLLAEGAVRAALPFGSTLKPFLVAGAGAGALPDLRLSPRDVPEWACGPDLPPTLGAREALLRSCNGWFLDWPVHEPLYGPYGQALLQLGLPRLPRDMSEAIGLRAALTLSPWAVAQAYRLLAEARPDLIALLEDNIRTGTLAGLLGAERLAAVATKTGTVRDASGQPRVGWIAAIDRDVVVVLVRAGRMPRSFLPDLLGLLDRARALPGTDAARVQVLGLVAKDSIEASCPGAGFALAPDGPIAIGPTYRPLGELSASGRLLCLAAPWRVRFPGLKERRDYAGVLELSPPSPEESAPGAPHGESSRRARRGSDFVFRTTRLQYAAGVVAAEHSELRGEPRAALLRVAAHNEAFSRHPGRPVCDTTHCQVFHGTAPPRSGDARALGRGSLPWGRWLPFSAGGNEAWVEERPAASVDALLGPAAALRFEAGRALFLRTESEGDAIWEVPRSLPCEAVRGVLRLPSCPDRSVREGPIVRFFGRGRGHGEGLAVLDAARSELGQDELLRAAYGR